MSDYVLHTGDCLDPVSGLASLTGVACKRLGRRFVGWERDEKYAAVAQKRIDAAREQYQLFGGKRSRPKQAELPIAKHGVSVEVK